MNLEKVKPGQVIIAKHKEISNNISGYVYIYLGRDKFYLPLRIDSSNNFLTMKSNFTYTLEQMKMHHKLELSDINIIPLKKIRKAIMKTFEA